LGEVDKLVVEETLVHPMASPSPPQTCVSSPNSEPLIDPKVIQQANQQITHRNDCVKNIKKPTGKKSKRSVDEILRTKGMGD